MANNSATGGVLVPAATPAPIYGDALADFLQQWISSIVGMSGAMMRQRWQPEPPNMPPNATDWAAVGVVAFRADTYASASHSPHGYDSVYRQEEMDVLVSFYGPIASSNAALLRDGLSVAQNREVLTLNGMGLISQSDITPVPSLVADRWQYRADITVSVRRAVLRIYPILNLLEVVGSIVTDTDPQLTETIDVSTA